MQIKAVAKNLKNYKIYLKVEQAVNEFMQRKGYLKLDLPVLSPVLIPESYLEVFQTDFTYLDKREELFLTPSPELFLKRLLVAGVGDCYYLGKAFRNSEPNSDFHLPEFTMLEYYRVQYTYLQLADEILEMMKYITINLKSQSSNLKTKSQNSKPKKTEITYQGKKISFNKWEKFTVAEAFQKFSDISEKELLTEALFLKKAEKKGYKVKDFSYADIFSQIISQEIEPRLGKNGYPSLLYDYPGEMSSLAKLSADRKTAKRVEFYINGVEIGGCCEELNDWKEQQKRFEDQAKKRKKAGLIDHKIDKGFIEALQYGLPDCTGAGIGFERLAMIFANATSIDELKLISVE